MQTDDLNKLEKGEFVNKVVEKLISEFGPGISEGEKIVAVQVKAIVKGEDHMGIKGFEKGMFEVLEAKMHFELKKKLALSNNNAEIRRLKKRIKELENKPRYEGWKFNGGVVEIDEAENQLRIRHDEKPAQEVIDELKLNGFRWSPRNGAWQRQITPAAMRAARRIVGGW